MEELRLTSPSGFKSRHDDFCFPAYTPIITKQGIKPIDQVTIEDFVFTRFGWKKVLKAWCSGNKEVITRFGITATPNHLVFTENRGWVSLDTLGMGDIINYIQRVGGTSCEKLLNSTVEITTDTQTLNNQTTGDIIPAIQSGKVHLIYCTEISGNSIMDQSQKDTMSTTLMEISTIIPSTISSVYLQKLTEQSIEKITLQEVSQKNAWNIYRKSEINPKNGINHQKEENGTDKMLKLPYSKTSQKKNAYPAELNSNQTQQKTQLVQKNVSDLEKITCSESLCEESVKVPVYDLTVEGAHEFFAWGVLVHNCDTISMLASLKVWKPSEEAKFKVDEEDKHLWELDVGEPVEGSLHSYIV